jgi:hypothetical protein
VLQPVTPVADLESRLQEAGTVAAGRIGPPAPARLDGVLGMGSPALAHGETGFSNASSVGASMKTPKAGENVKPDPVPKGPSVPGGLPIVRLKAQEDRRIRRGHLWIFSNEMERAPDGLAPGALVEFWSSRNERLGVGYYNARSLIAGRILDRRETSIDGSFFAGRLRLGAVPSQAVF